MATVQRQNPVRPVPKSSPKPALSQNPRAPSVHPGEGTGDNGINGKSPLACVLYGPSGVGKSSLAAYFPRPGFVTDNLEEGIQDLVEYRRVPAPIFIESVDSWAGIMKQCEIIATNRRGIKTAVFEGITGIEKLCFQSHCAEYFDGDWSKEGFYSFHQGPKNAAKTDWPDFLSALENIRLSGINVILTGHSECKTFENNEGPNYDRYVPFCDKSIWKHTEAWAKAILFYRFQVELDKQKGIRTKVKAGSERRIIETEWSPGFDAKNRYGLEPVITAGTSGKESYDALYADFRRAAGFKK